MRISAAIALVALAATTLMATGVRAEDEAAAPAPAVGSDVVDLNKDNFAEHVNDKTLMLVDFYAPWCGHCKNLAPEFELAATALKDEIPLAKVDCTVHPELCKDHGVSGYPTLKVYRKGYPPIEYKGSRQSEGIVKYLRKHAQPAVQEVTADTLAEFSASDKVVVVAVLPKDSPRREDLEKVATYWRDDYTFGVIEETDEVKAPGAILYKKFDEGKVLYQGEVTEARLVAFVRTNSIPTIDDIGPSNYAHYMDAGLPLAYFFFGTEAEKKKFQPDMEAIAKEYKGQMNFVYLDGSKFGAHAANVGLEERYPAFSIQDVVTAAKFPLAAHGSELTAEAIKDLVKKYLNKELEAQMKSEAIPETNEGGVKVVVGHSYRDIVEDLSKDVLIEFYAPWCGHCKNLAPTYDELGKLYQGSDIVIAKIDATANDLPPSVPFRVSGYPTIKFRKAGSSEYIEYSGGRSKEAFVEFLEKNAVNKWDTVAAEAKAKADASAEDVEHDEL